VCLSPGVLRAEASLYYAARKIDVR
jgi:hypothetical protein